MTKIFIVIAVAYVALIKAYRKVLPNPGISFMVSRHMSRSTSLSATWQQELDELLDIDTPLEAKREKTRSLIGRTQEITSDVFNALRERDLKKLAPRDLQYGKALEGLRDFREQLVSDIIPEVLTKGVPRLVDEGPKIARRVAAKGPSGVLSKSRKAAERVRELTRDEEKRAAAKADLRREIRNILKSEPEGLEAPEYDLLQQREYYELRKYSGYSICTKKMTSGEAAELGFEMDPISVSSTFMTLAEYIFGNNTVEASVRAVPVEMYDGVTNETDIKFDADFSTEGKEIGMTTPVIIDESSMSFVLPKKYNAATAPRPVNSEITITDVGSQLIAARRFTGLATENEVAKQRAKLEDALISDGVIYDATTFKVLSYNPPLTLPWLRRNEVCFTVTTNESDLPKPLPIARAVDIKVDAENVSATTVTTADDDVVDTTATSEPAALGAADDDEEEFFTAPEAGD